MKNTWALTRLALRLDRVRLPIWVLILAIMPAGTAAQYKTLYPNDQAIQDVSGVISNPSLVALNGPLFRATLGALTVWKIGATELVLIALMSLLTVVRHSRAEEEAGRTELLGATVVGRFAPLSAALATAGLANLGTAVLLAVFLMGARLSAAGSIAFALAIGLTGVLFAVIAAVAAQLSESGRGAAGIAVAVLGAAFLVRAAGDAGSNWLSWLSPLGWALHVRPYAGEQWTVLLLILALTAVLGGAAYVLVGRRDLGAGLLPQRPAPAAAGPGLGSTFGLAWRLHRGILLAWVVGLAVTGAVLGGVADSLTDSLTTTNRQLTDVLSRLGGAKGVTDAYLAAVLGITGLVAAAYTVQATLRLRTEETSGRLEPLLATRTGRIGWAASHLVFALGGTAALLAVAGLGAGLAYGMEVHDVSGQVPRLLGAALAQLPASWVLAGFGTALFGLAPRFSTLAWGGLLVCVVLLELGALLNLSQWLIDVSPFAHVPKLPGAAVSVVPFAWLTAVAALLGAAGLTGFRRRDLG